MGVLHPHDMDFTITRKYDNEKVDADNLFKVIMNPDDTGLQLSEHISDLDDYVCDYSGSPQAETSYYGVTNDVKRFRITNLKVVRCGKGDEDNDGITVRVRYPGGKEFDYDVAPDLKEAWHRNENVVHYYIDTSTVYGGQGGTPAASNGQRRPPRGRGRDVKRRGVRG